MAFCWPCSLLSSFQRAIFQMFLDAGHDPTFRHVHRGHAQPQGFGHFLAALSFDGGAPKGLPGGVAYLRANTLGRPLETTAFALALPQLLLIFLRSGMFGQDLLHGAVAASLAVAFASNQEIANLVANQRE